MEIYFATNRDVVREEEHHADFGDRFNSGGPQFFRVGVADVKQEGADPAADDAYQVVSQRLYSERSETGQPVRASQGMFDELRARLKDKQQDILIYLHGFANSFENSLMRAAALQTLYHHGRERLKADPLVFVFAWPSNGKVFPMTEYFSDRDDAQMSGIAMARAMVALIDFMVSVAAQDRPSVQRARLAGRIPTNEELVRCSQQIHLLAHSMGNYALRHAVLALHRMLGQRPLPRIFKNALLVAADEDADALGDDTKLGLLKELAQSIHVYHSPDDRALHVSDGTKLNPDRLGADGPSNLATLPARVFTVDCSSVDETIFEHGRHQYYRIRPEVVADIKELLKGTPPDLIAGRTVVRPGRSWRLEEKKTRGGGRGGR